MASVFGLKGGDVNQWRCRFAQIDDHLGLRFVGKATTNPYAIVQHPKGDRSIGSGLKFDVQHYGFSLQQNQTIGADGIEGEFGWAEFGEGHGLPQQPLGKVGGELFGEEFTDIVKHEAVRE